MDRLLIRPSEAAELLGLGRSKIYELIAAGEIPSIRIGKSVRIPMEALRQWIALQTNGSEHGVTASTVDSTKASR